VTDCHLFWRLARFCCGALGEPILQTSITGEAPRHRRSVVHRSPTAWHCVFAASTINSKDKLLVTLTSALSHVPAIIVGVAQRRNRLRRRPFLKKNPSRATGRMRASTARHHPPPPTAEHYRQYRRQLAEKGTTKKPHAISTSNYPCQVTTVSTQNDSPIWTELLDNSLSFSP
jgi:hypothetical protein